MLNVRSISLLLLIAFSGIALFMISLISFRRARSRKRVAIRILIGTVLLAICLTFIVWQALMA